MENALDKAGDTIENLGHAGGGFFRLLSQLVIHATGDIATASVVALVIMFALYLLRGGASAKNTGIYAYGLIVLGITGLIVSIGFSVVSYTSTATSSAVVTTSPAENEDEIYAKALRQGFGQKPLATSSVENQPIPSAPPSFVTAIYERSKWYMLLFLTMTFVGVMLAALHAMIGRKPVRGAE